MKHFLNRTLAAAAVLAMLAGPQAYGAEAGKTAADDTFDEQTILETATNFFGETTQGLAKVIQRVFQDQGRPNGYITGEEGSGAFIVGLRYGNGMLHQKKNNPRKVYWQGPSIGFDVGGNASKVFVLIYHLQGPDNIFQRFPGIEGTFYFVAGVGVNYQQSGKVILAPIRTGIGLRAGANIGYLHYTRKHSWVPF